MKREQALNNWAETESAERQCWRVVKGENLKLYSPWFVFCLLCWKNRDAVGLVQGYLGTPKYLWEGQLLVGAQ